jgi:hypothetical protein
MSWVTMRDTREKAFSIQVPQGWKTYGGLFRFGNGRGIDGMFTSHLTHSNLPSAKWSGSR